MDLGIPYSKMKTFYCIVTEGNFKKAADKLFITPGAVSQQIKDLENRLEKKLFDRSGRHLNLTIDGSNLFDLVAPAIEQFENIIEEFQQISGSLKGTVSISSFESIALNYLPVILNSFRRTYPQCEIFLRIAAGKDVQSLVVSGQADFGLASTQDLPDDLRGHKVWEFNRYFIAPLSHPLATKHTITLKDIAAVPTVMIDRRTMSGNQFFIELARENPNLKISVEATDWGIVKKYVEMGFGVSVIPEIIIQPGDKKRLFFRNLSDICPEVGVSEYGIIIKKGKYLSRAAKELIKSFCPEFNFDPLKTPH